MMRRGSEPGRRSGIELDRWLASESRRRTTRRALVASIVLTLALYLIPFGSFIAYPLLLLSTLVHELGHGLAALAVGGHFERLAIYGDGSGVAAAGGVSPGLPSAFMAAGGLVGPAVVAAVAFVMALRPRLAHLTLGALGLALFVVLGLWVRNPFGMAFTGILAAVLLWIALRWRAGAQIALVFLAIQLALSVFSRGDYLFVAQARTGAGTMPSDVAQIASALGGAYWMWGLACGAFSLIVVLLGVGLFWRSIRPR